MPALPNDPIFPAALLGYLREQIAAEPEKRTPAIRDYLTGKCRWTVATSAAVDECINNQSAVSDSIRRALILSMQTSQTNLESLYAPLLLVWGFDQPWASDIDTPAVMKHWSTENMREPNSNTTAANCNATAFLAQLLPVEDRVPVKWRHQMLVSIASEMFSASQGWNSSMVPPTVIGKYLVGLGRLVAECPASTASGNSTERMKTTWLGLTTKFLEETSFQTQMCISGDLVKSALPGEYKLRAHKNASPVLWSMARDQLRPLLPDSEVDVFACIPFAKLKKPFSKMESWEKEGYASSNSNVVKRYCPTLYPVIELVASQDDWCVRKRIDAWVQKFQPSSAPEQTPLPEAFDQP